MLFKRVRRTICLIFDVVELVLRQSIRTVKYITAAAGAVVPLLRPSKWVDNLRDIIICAGIAHACWQLEAVSEIAKY